MSTPLVGMKWAIVLSALLISVNLSAQDRSVDPTWLHRYLPRLSETKTDLSSGTCHYKPFFGSGDANDQILRSVSRFAEVSIDPHGACQSVLYDREEEIDFVLEGAGALLYGDDPYPLRANDFVYMAPGVRHSLSSNSGQALRVLVMGFKVPGMIGAPLQQARIINLKDVKEQTVEGHPTSVLYKLLVGPKSGKRDAIDEASVVISFFWMDFAPGGTNFPHHHEAAEEIYFVVQGEGEMVAGSGMDGIEGRYPAKAGDAYYFRPNCTVGFYNQNKPGSKAYILAVRSKIPSSAAED
jgi:mannose-6-phosphate isomerase-like protein (cupin superfamily)